jgi:hypothetical protein
VDRFESQIIIKKSLGVRKPKCLNRNSKLNEKDLLLCIFLPFGTIFNKLDGWKSTASCQAVLYFLRMYGIYIKLALASLCVA